MQLKLEKIIPTETVLMALGSLRANKFRSALTVLGIVVGIITVVLVASILTGMRSSITSMIEEYGTNNIYAFHLSTGPRVGNRDRSEYKRKPLLPVDGDAITACTRSNSWPTCCFCGGSTARYDIAARNIERAAIR
jgi:putative ABC transport system permease protein